MSPNLPPSSRQVRLLRHLRLFLLLVVVALPVMGGLLSFVQVFRDGAGVSGLKGVIDVAIAPDGEQVYAVGSDSNALAVFHRSSATGALSFVEYHADDDVNGVFGLLGASGVVVSPDGRHVYVSAEVDDTLAVFSRDPTQDELTFIAAEVKEDLIGGVFGLNGASAVAVSPDDEQVFVTARVDDALVVFSRDPTTDELSFVEAELDDTAGVDGLDGATAVAVSPDNLHVYVAAELDDAISVFERDLVLGTVLFASKVKDGIGGVDGLNGASGVAVSPDGLNVYATGRQEDALAVFDRDAATGGLSFVEVHRDGVDGVDGLAGASAVVLNPSGNRVVVASRDDDAVAVFRRDADGTLAFLEVRRDGIDGVEGLAGARDADALDTNVYVAGHDEDAISVLDLALCDGNEASGDSDADAFCDDVDLCQGDDLTGDDDSDGVCGILDACPGFDDALDDDGDGVPDGCDLCTGDDATLDDDGDGVCNDTDVCPGASDAFDGDGDGVPDGCDLCDGNDATLDSDSDGVCDDLDACAGFDDSDDADGDSIPDGCDLCTGNDATLDSDGDGVCDDTDACPGFSDAIDADLDGTPDGCDVCFGFDDKVDSDGDGVPEGCDACPGFDDAVDSDFDGSVDGCDTCPGFDDNADGDGDGIADGCDVCPGFSDTSDFDTDGVPDGCDACQGFDDAVDGDGDGVPDLCDACEGFDDTVDADGDAVPDGCDLCQGDNLTGDADMDGLCADVDCDDFDAANICLVFEDGFESGGTGSWSASF